MGRPRKDQAEIDKFDKNWVLQEYIKCRQDPFYFMKYCYISHPTLGKILIEMFDYQEDLLRKFIDNRFNIIVKGRQMGISTVTLLYVAWLMIFFSEKEIVLVSLKSDATKELISRLDLLFDSLPVWLKPRFKSRNKLFLKLENNSRIKATSRAKNVGRSFSASYLIIDECVLGDTKIQIKNKRTGEIKEITIEDFFNNYCT